MSFDLASSFDRLADPAPVTRKAIFSGYFGVSVDHHREPVPTHIRFLSERLAAGNIVVIGASGDCSTDEMKVKIEGWALDNGLSMGEVIYLENKEQLTTDPQLSGLYFDMVLDNSEVTYLSKERYGEYVPVMAPGLPASPYGHMSAQLNGGQIEGVTSAAHTLK